MNNKFNKVILFDYLKTHYIVIILCIVSGILMKYCEVYSADLIGNGLDAIYIDNFMKLRDSIKVILLVLLVNIIIIPIIQFMQYSLMLKQGLVHDRLVLKHYFDKDTFYAKSFTDGEIINRLETDPNQYRYCINQIISNIFIIIFTITTLSIHMFVNYKMAIICIVTSLMPIITANCTKNIKAKYLEQDRNYKDERSKYETELYGNFEFIKLNNMNLIIKSLIDKVFNNYYLSSYKKSVLVNKVVEAINFTANHLSKIILIIFGVILVNKGEMNIGLIATFLLYQSIVQDITNTTSRLINFIKSYQIDRDRVVKLYDKEEISGNEKCDIINNISVNNLCFKYENNLILNNIEANFKSNSTILITGENGCGKSTLAKIIAGIYTYYKGTIKANNKNYHKYNIDSLRENVTYIEQEPYLLNINIKNNLDMSDKDNKLDKLMKLFNIDYLYEREESNNKSLSGGELQKLSIIRGLLKASSVIIFDEPTNNLDLKSKDTLKKIIKELNGIKIIISHKDDFSDIADYVLIMGNGNVDFVNT